MHGIGPDEWTLVARLALALALSAIVGAEREIRQKTAGVRTYALVGTGSALFMLVSQYGFVTGKGVTLDPSRVAAQIVTGVGFIGGGVIFVHRQDVRGLTTAAGIWTVAAIGMAAAGNLFVLALAMTVLYLIVSIGFPVLTARLPSSRGGASIVRLSYADGHGVLRRLLARCAEHGFAVIDLEVEHVDDDDGSSEPRIVTVSLTLRGRGSLPELASELDAVDGVAKVAAGNVPADRDV